MKKIDMSAPSVLRRLKQVDELRELSLSLMKAKPISKESVVECRGHPREDEQSTKIEQIEQSEQTGHFKLPNVEQH